MKRSIIISAILFGVYYLVKELMGKEEKAKPVAPRKNHLTNAFSKAKEHALSKAQEPV